MIENEWDERLTRIMPIRTEKNFFDGWIPLKEPGKIKSRGDVRLQIHWLELDEISEETNESSR